MTAPDNAAASAAAARIAAISGLVFAVLFVVALVLMHRAPKLADPDATYAAFYAGGGDQLFVAIGLYLVPFAGIAFLWHMTAMRDVLDTLTPTPTAMAHGLNLLAGIIFVILLFAGTAAVGAVAFGIYFGHTPAEDPAVARAFTGLGYGLVFIFAVRGAGMFALTTTTLLRTAKVLPKIPAVHRLPARRVPAARRDQQPRRLPRLPGVGRAGLRVPAAALRRLPVAPHRTPDTTRPTLGGATRHDFAKSLDDIPGPKGVPVLGNMFEIKQATLIQDLMKLGREWGPIFKMTTPTGPIYVVYGLEMVDDLCDDARFDKLVGLSQREFRKTHKSAGLFTADTDDPLWKSAHDILLPSFSTWAMKGYLDPMIDIAEQLCLKWERLNPDEPIDVTADMTRLTLDTIALCGFSYRFNSFYRDTQHPFIEAMMGALHETQARQRLLPVAIKMRRGAQPKLLADSKLMDDTVAEILVERKAGGDPGHGPVGAHARRHRQAGNALPDHNIVAQCVTFLVAGHETTSGLLSFTIAYLLKHPEVVARAHEEIDRVLGTDPSVPPTVAQVQQLGYIRQILDETLRLWPTAPAFTRQARADHDGRRVGAVLPRPVDHRTDPDAAPAQGHLGRRRRGVQPGPLRSGAPRLPAAQRVPAVRVGPAGLHRAPVRPAGGDARARHAHAALRVRRPRELPAQDQGVAHPQARRVDDHDQAPHRADLGRDAATGGGRRQPAHPRAGGGARRSARHPAAGALRLQPRRVGGHRLPDRPRRHRPRLHRPHRRARRRGRRAADRGAAVVVTSSYNGQPPDNAGKFAAWIDDAATSAAGVRYTVFGCGNRDWAATYQAVPTRIDAALEARGANRVYPRGEGDARGDFDSQFESWYAGLLDGLGSASGWPPKHGAGRGGRGSPWSWSSAARRARSCSPTAARPRSCG